MLYPRQRSISCSDSIKLATRQEMISEALKIAEKSEKGGYTHDHLRNDLRSFLSRTLRKTSIYLHDVSYSAT